MNIKIHSSELNRMMKTITQCIDQRDITKLANICITHDNNILAIRASNGTFSAVMYASVLGGDGESFCVDGSMFSKVCAMCNGEIQIITDGKTCTIRGVGRTKIPIVPVDIPAFSMVKGKTVTTTGAEFTGCYNHVSYAVATDNSRIQLTGILMETEGSTLRMVALDGFQMSIDETQCAGESIKGIVPGAFMKLVSSSTGASEELKITTDGHSIQAKTDGMMLRCGLISGEYIDYNKILPTEFATKTKVNVSAVRNALKAGNVVNNKQNLVKLEIEEDRIKVTNNSEQADFEAEIPCDTQGDGLKIAFNDKYLIDTMSAIDTDEAIMNMNKSTSPVIVRNADGTGMRLVLPVRLA